MHFTTVALIAAVAAVALAEAEETVGGAPQHRRQQAVKARRAHFPYEDAGSSWDSEGWEFGTSVSQPWEQLYPCAPETPVFEPLPNLCGPACDPYCRPDSPKPIIIPIVPCADEIVVDICQDNNGNNGNNNDNNGGSNNGSNGNTVQGTTTIVNEVVNVVTEERVVAETQVKDEELVEEVTAEDVIPAEDITNNASKAASFGFAALAIPAIIAMLL